jgi:hypothetical protein
MIKLIITLPDGQLMTHDVAEERLTLGSGVENTIVIPNESVAETHLELLQDATGYLVADLAGGGATLINGHTIDIGVHYMLETGTRIQMGGVEVVYIASEVSVAETPPVLVGVVEVSGGARGAFSPGSFDFPKHPEGVFEPLKAERSLLVMGSIAITFFAVAAAIGAGYLSTTLPLPH